MPSYGFVESVPALAGGFSDSDYDSTTDLLTLMADWSYIDSKGVWGNQSAPMTLNTGVSNLGRTTTVVDVAGSPNVIQSASSNGTLHYTSGSSGWLALGGATSGIYTPGQLRQLTVQLLPAAATLPSGFHYADVNVDFSLNIAGGGTIYQPRTVRLIYALGDNATDDTDSDGLNNRQEVETLPATNSSWYGCLDARNRDSDDDRLSDGEEINRWQTSPCHKDTDGDGTNDRIETEHACLDPLSPNGNDVDVDGVTNEDEDIPVQGSLIYGTDPCDSDSDDDGVQDGADNCPLTANPNQEDNNGLDDGDAIGDACERAYHLEQWLENALLPRPGEILSGRVRSDPGVVAKVSI